MIYKIPILIILLLSSTVSISSAFPAQENITGMILADQASFWQPYQSLLDKHLSPATIEGIELAALDYRGVKADPAFEEMVRRLEKFSLLTLKGDNDALAFWINAYNFLAIKIVVDNYPVKSIKDIGSLLTSVWKKDAGVIGAKAYTLNEIEHEMLRKDFEEPRIHFGIFCAALSCPDLRKKVYLPSELESQLDAVAAAFLQNKTKGVQSRGNQLIISQIFNWFKDDFQSVGGVWKFIRKYRSDLSDEKEYSIDYLPYNWRLNEI